MKKIDPTLTDMAQSLGRIEGHLEVLLPTVEKYGTRIGSLEKSRSWLTGASATVGAILGSNWADIKNWWHP